VQERAVWSLPCEARSLTAGEIPTPVRQDDNTGIIGSLFHQAGGDDIRHDPLMVAALDACARTYSTDAPPRCGIASAITNFVANASRSSLGITPAQWPKSGSFLGVGKGIDGYLDRPTEEAATVVRPQASPWRRRQLPPPGTSRP
jgi:hypothetical protein